MEHVTCAHHQQAKQISTALSHTQSAMLFYPLKLYVSRLCINSAPRLVLPNLGYVIVESTNSRFSASILKNISPYVGFGLSVSSKRLCSCRAVQKNPSRRDTSHVEESCEGVESDLSDKADSAANVFIDGDCKRANKTRHGNKGRIPWNKGRKHSEETREKIRRETKEALKDPKIRKKMSEAPRFLSNQTKVKIRASLRKLWGNRLKLKRSREKFLQSWGESIALAAKIGGPDQQELEWDSYEKFKQEAALERAKMKELARIQKERAARVKAKKKEISVQKRREREASAKARGEPRKRTKKSKEEKEKLVESQEEKLKEKLMKIHRKKSTVSRVSNQNRRPLERFERDLAEGRHLQKDISLADQIRFAKKRRAELLLDKH